MTQPPADTTRPARRRRTLRHPLERPLQAGYIALWIVIFLVAGAASAGFGMALFRPAAPSFDATANPERLPPPPVLPTRGGLAIPAKVVGEKIAVWSEDRYTTPFFAGTNLGIAVPGSEPGGLAAERLDFDRWFDEMRDVGVTTIRIYTIQRPTFYRALRESNLRHPEAPLRIIQGVWIPEDDWYATGNAFDRSVLREMRREIHNAVGAVHGTAVIPPVRGHASGSYDADVGPWLLGWSFGIEWDPVTVVETNRLNQERAAYTNGVYIRARPEASPMESWVAMQMDLIARLEVAAGYSVPMTFTNWDTTDPLSHPQEPLYHEDLVSMDAMHIHSTESWPGGYFASFHAYPYYPDFQRYETQLLNYRRPHDGAIDPYQGYIHTLRAHHRGIPLMITEVGQPTSHGCAHFGPLDRNQGCMSETTAAHNLVGMMDAIQREGAVGAMAFNWIDEWFKFTWNTIDYELPRGRRSMWRNPLTNEEHFGLLAIEPGEAPDVVLDGDDTEWGAKQVIGHSSGPVREVRATHDEENLYLRLTVRPGLWRRQRIVIGLDAHTAGNRGLPGSPGIDPAADVALVIEPGGTARMMHAAWVEPIGMRYGGFASPELRYVTTTREALRPGSGVWEPLRQLISHPLPIRGTGRTEPAVVNDVSYMRWGTTDPESPRFDDRNMIFGDGTVLEIAIPWGMATFSDPSSHRVYELRLTPDPDRQVVSRPIRRLGISVLVGSTLLRTDGYEWEGWNGVAWHERRKAGWPQLRAGFTRLNALPAG